MDIAQTTALLAQPGKGILAIDESLPTIQKRFESIAIESNEQTRQAYRNLLLSTKELEKYICGAILFEETLKQNSNDGIPFPELMRKKGILAGIKVDQGLVTTPLGHEKITTGMDTMKKRLETYKSLGASFCKWRAVYQINKHMPSNHVCTTNAIGLALYAAYCQETNLVPIVEPEVLMEGDHTLQTSQAVTERVLEEVFIQLDAFGVSLEHMVLKPSMVIHGNRCPEKASAQEIASATLATLRKCVPQTVPTINFLSGGQSPDEATNHLKIINELAKDHAPKWHISFSYGRALQEDCLNTWQGSDSNIENAQKKLLERAKNNADATQS